MARDEPVGRRTNARRGRRDEDRLAFLAEIATFYYGDKLTQEQIGHQIGRSTSMVSRLLTEAHERGVVEVRVRHPVPTDADLQSELVARFGLRAARVLRSDGLDERRLPYRVGQLGAGYLKAVLKDDAIVGIGWGTALYEVVQAIGSTTHKNIQVAQSLGSLGSRLPAIDNHLLTRLLAERLGATPHYLHSPMIVDSEALRRVLVEDAQLRQTLDLGRRADVMLVGIGVPEPDHSGLLHAGYVDRATLEEIRRTGVVGDMFVNYFDRDGIVRDVEISRRVVGVRLSDLARVGTVIAVARGAYKAEAILGALRTNLLHVVVTDDLTARAVLAAADQAAPAAMVARTG